MTEEALQIIMNLEEYSLPSTSSHSQEHTFTGAFDDNIFIDELNRAILGGPLEQQSKPSM